jgi:hypothetical protein
MARVRLPWLVPLLVLTIAAPATAPLSLGMPARADGNATVPPEPAVRPDAPSAAAAARASGRPVEILAERTERERTFANPDGTWLWEQHVEPVRVRRAGGTWADIDPTLRLADGVIRPAATAADVRFSAGGAAGSVLVEMGTGRGRMAWSWPMALPAPRLEGDTAIYPEVLPGVDLRLRATVDGFTHVLVVKDRQAAARPEVRRIRFGLLGDLSLRPATGGGLEAVSPGGSVVATAGAALMWDSSESGAAPAGAPRTLSRAVAPGDTARRASPQLRVVGRELWVEPVSALLDDPNAVYPMFIDPSYSRGFQRWAYSNSANENNTTDVARVGKDPNGGAIYRSYFTFDVRPLRSTRILHAEFQTLLVHSWSCAATPVNLYRVNSAGSGRLAWSGPALAEWVDERSANAHKGDNDCGNQPDKPMEFGGNLLREVREAAAASASEFALALSARKSDGGGESTAEWWKKFKPSSMKLVVVYNSPPSTPTSLSTDGTGCGTGALRSVVSATPTLRAVVSDPDADEADLAASFAWERWDGAAWLALGTGRQNTLRRGATGEVRIGSGLVHAGLYRWRAQTLDPWSFNGASGTDASNWSAYCEFEVDTVGPAVPPGVSSPVYQEDLTARGSVGQSAQFTFTASQVPDVASYRWGWSDPPSRPAAAPTLGGNLTLTLTPPPLRDDPTAGGLTTLYVVSVDRAGRASPLRRYTFVVGSATGPVGKWDMGEPAGSTVLVDSNTRGTARPATVVGATTGVPGRLLGGPGASAPTAVSFNGSTATAATAGPVVDTSKSFSVSAWVRLASAPSSGTAVSQKGVNTSGFFLTFDQGRWAFATHSADAVSVTTSIARSATPVAIDRWTHLVGVYDAEDNQLRIYINGELTGTAARLGAWNANGPLWIGKGFSQGAASGPLPGTVSEVRVWDRVLSGPELAPMAATLVGYWTMDGSGADSTPYARTASPVTGTVEWTEDRSQVPVSAAGVTTGPGWLATAGPVVRTDQNYTVAAWVRSADSDYYQTILCQFGTVRCSFYLQYSPPHDRWAVVLPGNDGPTVGTYYAATSAAAPDYGEWVHLTAVINASSGVLRFYLNGVEQGRTFAVPGMWHASGPLRIGFMDPGAVDGAVDEVRVYAGVLAPSEIAKLP